MIAEVLQEHLSHFEEFADQNHMPLNPKKCATTIILEHVEKSFWWTPLTISNVSREVDESAKTVGGHIGLELKWDAQVSEMLKNAS